MRLVDIDLGRFKLRLRRILPRDSTFYILADTSKCFGGLSKRRFRILIHMCSSHVHVSLLLCFCRRGRIEIDRVFAQRTNRRGERSEHLMRRISRRGLT